MKNIWRDGLLFIVLLIAIETLSRFYLRASEPKSVVRSFTVHHAIDHLNGRRGDFLPLAGLSFKPTWLCNEANGSVVFHSDRYGFNNLDEVWDQMPERVLIGDSFVQGYCVPRESQLGAVVREKDERILNLGLKGSGPLSQFGVLKEYALPLQPKRVSWYIVANDILYDLDREIRQPVLTAYLQGRTQGLMKRQTEIDGEWDRSGANEPVFAGSLVRFPDALLRVFFSLLRPEPFRSLEFSISSSSVSDRRIELFTDILLDAKNAVSSVGGAQIDFVFIPDAWVFTQKEGQEVRALLERVRRSMLAKGLKLNDPTPCFDRQKSPRALFAALEGYYGHFNQEGYVVFAECTAARSS